MLSKLLEVECKRCAGHGIVAIRDRKVTHAIVACSCAAGKMVARIDALDRSRRVYG